MTNTNDYILAINASSSSLKFSIFRQTVADSWYPDVRGRVEGLGTRPIFLAKNGASEPLFTAVLDRSVTDARGALTFVSNWLRERYPGAHAQGVGHLVVHGGTQFDVPTIVTPEVLEQLRALVPLAPLHQPYNLAAIEAVWERLPGAPQVACFDTSFHRDQPEDIDDNGGRRFGFHGLSYEYIASIVPSIAPEIAGGRVIVAHLGSGASLCALKNGTRVDSTPRFTALDGIIGSDMRALLASSEPAAHRTIEFFVSRAAKEIGAMAAALGGVDSLVFTAGIGENSPEIRRRICTASAWLGIDIDENANAIKGPRISSQRSKVSVWMVPTNEEQVIAQHTAALLGLGGQTPSQIYTCEGV